jgi:signal recognition particle receptor subunit alpha
VGDDRQLSVLILWGGCSGRKQYIDGIFLTKFDTVDDKIGAALSMVYETGQPIVFVGVGQTYKDIRRMNVGSIVRTLCK